MAEERGFVFHGPDGQVELSIEEVRDLAKRDDPDGLYALAMAYLFGWDVEQNEDVGYDLLEKSVAAGQTDYEVLVDGVPDLQADDGSVWKAEAIWDLTAEGVPAIEEEYLGEQPASSGAGMP